MQRSRSEGDQRPQIAGGNGLYTGVVGPCERLKFRPARVAGERVVGEQEEGSAAACDLRIELAPADQGAGPGLAPLEGERDVVAGEFATGVAHHGDRVAEVKGQ